MVATMRGASDRPEIESRVLAALGKHFLEPDMIATAVEVYRTESQHLSREAAKARASVERNLAEVNRKIFWLIREIENGRGSKKRQRPPVRPGGRAGDAASSPRIGEWAPDVVGRVTGQVSCP